MFITTYQKITRLALLPKHRMNASEQQLVDQLVAKSEIAVTAGEVQRIDDHHILEIDRMYDSYFRVF